MERYRTTLILVGVLVVLAALYFFVLNKGGTGTGGTETPTAVTTVTVWKDTNPVIGIDVMSGTLTTSVRKDITTTLWSVVAPMQKDANASVAGLADGLQNVQATRSLTTTGDLAPYGLDKP